MTIHVTQEDIECDLSRPMPSLTPRTETCAVARALRRESKSLWKVNQRTAFQPFRGARVYPLPSHVTFAIWSLDCRRPVAPFSFEIDV